MSSIQLRKSSTIWVPELSSYKMVLEVIASEGITPYVFVKQRIRDFANNKTIDVFSAVATPTQLEDMPQKAPVAGSAFWRDRSCTLVLRVAEEMQSVFDSIMFELQKLVLDVTLVDDLRIDGTYLISANNVIPTLNSLITAHYRVPLVARPCGDNDTTTNPGYQRVGNSDAVLQGWLNCTHLDPTGAKFKYNMQRDLTLSNIWPADDAKLSTAFISCNGIELDSSDVLLLANGIYWLNDIVGQAPWPLDYVDVHNTGRPERAVVLIADFFV